MTDRNPKPGETWRARYGAVFPLLARYNPDDDYTLRQKVPDGTDPGTKALSWTANGRFLLSGEHPLDLIERVVVVPDPHPEPRVFWINVYDDGVGFVAPSRAEADAYARSNGTRIACVPFTEGQFDD